MRFQLCRDVHFVLPPLYADWNAYFDDFLAGCKDFDPEDTYGTAEDIEKGVKELLENKASIYKVVPFK